MSEPIKPGDTVEWNSSGGKSVGRVKKKLTEPIDIKGHHVAASPANPEFLVASDTGGGDAAHKPAALKKTGAKSAGAKKRTANAPTATSGAEKRAPKKSAAKKPAARKKPAKKTGAIYG